MKLTLAPTRNENTSLCCKAPVIGLRNCSEYENEVQSINICSACNSEAPKRSMFFCSDSETAKHFILLKTHETNQMEKQPDTTGKDKGSSTGRARYHTERYCAEQRNKRRLCKRNSK